LEGYGGVATYIPSLPEIMLGLGGVAVSIVAVTLLVKFLPFLPESLEDKIVKK
jgi:molybdopterin-containing oxidoreductase family membrane subunit